MGVAQVRAPHVSPAVNPPPAPVYRGKAGGKEFRPFQPPPQGNKGFMKGNKNKGVQKGFWKGAQKGKGKGLGKTWNYWRP